MPEECKIYVEEDAQKAFDKTKDKPTKVTDDIIKFNKEDKEEK